MVLNCYTHYRLVAMTRSSLRILDKVTFKTKKGYEKKSVQKSMRGNNGILVTATQI